jgi:hypothetical protein
MAFSVILPVVIIDIAGSDSSDSIGKRFFAFLQ